MAERTFKGEMESSTKMCPLDKLGVKDRKILYELSKNGRLSISTIAKKVGLSRDIVGYRLNNFLKTKLIPGFTLRLNTSRLGFIKHIVLIKFQHLDKKEEREIIDKLVNHEDIVAVETCSGNWDMSVLIMSRDLIHLNKTFQELIEICGNNLKDYIVETQIDDRELGLNFLNEGLADSKDDKYIRDGFMNEFKNISPSKDPKIDEVDINLINLLMADSRMPMVEICSKLKLTPPAVENRIKKLIKEDVIYGFMTQVSLQMLGLHWYWILLRTKNLTEKREKQFLDYLKKQPYITWDARTIGRYNFHLSTFARDSIHFREILSDLRKEFSDIIVDYDSLLVFNQYKYMHRIA